MSATSSFHRWPSSFFPFHLSPSLTHLHAVSCWLSFSLTSSVLSSFLCLYRCPLAMPDAVPPVFPCLSLSPSLCRHVDECDTLASAITQTCSFSFKVSFCSQSAAEEGGNIFSQVLLVDIREMAVFYYRGRESRATTVEEVSRKNCKKESSIQTRCFRRWAALSENIEYIFLTVSSTHFVWSKFVKHHNSMT